MSGDDASRIDPHVKVLSEGIVRRAKRRRLDALVYAPHFTRLPEIEREARLFSDPDLTVVPAREIFTGTWTNRKHVLAVGLREPVPDFLPLEVVMEELDRQGATVLAPHPEFYTVGLSEADCRRYRSVIDGIEVANPKHRPRHDRRAREIAASLDLPAFGSSYAHLPWTVGDVWTEVDRALPDADAVVEALSESDRRVRRRQGTGPRLRSLAEFGHLGWENSWKKTERVLLSGREATHPLHDAYGGRFDDAFVYDRSGIGSLLSEVPARITRR